MSRTLSLSKQGMDAPLAAHKEYLGAIFRRCVLALVGAHAEDCVFERGVLEQLVLLAEQRLLALGAHLHRLAEMQRRARPAVADVALLLYLHRINWVDLEREARRTPALEQLPTVHALNSLLFEPDLAELAAPARVFFDTTRSLAPATRAPPLGALPWMPPLPPDHTYLQTASHPSEVRNLWQVRQQLVEESRLAERALQRLLGDKDSASFIEFRDRPRPRAITQPDPLPQPVPATPAAPAAAAGSPQPASVAQSASATPSAVASAAPSATPSRAPSVAHSGAPSAVQSPASQSPAPQSPALHSPALHSPALHSPRSPTPLSPHSQPPAASPTPEPPRPRLQLKLRPIKSEPKEKPAPPAEDAARAPKLALKLSLGKPKRKKEDVLGKRPRVDVVALAYHQAEPPGPKRRAEQEREDPPEGDFFAAALAAYSR